MRRVLQAVACDGENGEAFPHASSPRSRSFCDDFIMRHEWPCPGNEDEFEEFCLRFFRHDEGLGGLIRYGKRGNRQDGIDLIDQRAIGPCLAVQCKRHEPKKTIPPAEINAEVAKVEASSHPIERYVIATTAKKSTASIDAVMALNRRPDKDRRLIVEILFWEDFCAKLDSLDRAIAGCLVFGNAPGSYAGDSARVIASPSYLPAPATVSGSLLFGDIEKLLDDRKIEVAEHELAKLPQPECNSSITAQERYALLRLRAKLALEKQSFDEAARLFQLAYEAAPTNLQARLNRILALELSGQRELAFQEATTLYDEGETSASLCSLLVRNAPNEESIAPYELVIDRHAECAEEVNVALVHGCLSWGNAVRAKAAGERAVELAPRSAHAAFALAAASHQQVSHGFWEERQSAAEAAIAAYERAEALARSERYEGLLPEILTNRARVNSVAGRVDAAKADHRAAVDCALHPSLYARDAVGYYLHIEDYAAAAAYLGRIDVDCEERRVYAAIIQYHAGVPSGRRAAIEEMRELVIANTSHSSEASYHAVQWAIEIDDLALASTCVSDQLVERSPLVGLTLRGWIAGKAGDLDLSRELAESALNAPAEGAHPQELAVLARLLHDLELDEKALPLWERIYTPGVLDQDCRSLVQCAERINRHDILLRICAELERTGQIDDRLRRGYVQLLLRYDPDLAYERAGQYVGLDRPYYQSVRNYASAILGRNGQLASHDWELPAPGSISPEESPMVLLPLAILGRHADAIDYAYRLLRTHFHSESTHGQYIWCFLNSSHHLPQQRYRHVSENTAVCLQKIGSGNRRWMVIEEDNPDPTRQEFSPDHAAVKPLLGKPVGAEIEWIGGPEIVTEAEKILAIESKYGFRFEDCKSQFAARFPGSSILQPMHVGDGEDFDVTPILAVVKGRRALVDRALVAYRDLPCSLHLVAEHLGLDVRRMLIALSSHNTAEIKCVDSPTSRFADAVEAAAGAQQIVLDLSAVVTVSRLAVWPNVGSKSQLVVTHSTVLTVQSWLQAAREQTSGERGTIHVTDDEQLFLHQSSEAERRADVEELAEMVECVQQYCQVAGAMATAGVAPGDRALYGAVLGMPSLDSLAVAQERGVVLWTDDLVVGLVAESEFGIDRVWTQAVLQAALDQDRVTHSVHSLAVARLLEWNYVGTTWNASILLAAAQAAEWDTGSNLLTRTMRLLGNHRVSIARRRRVAVELLALLRYSDCPELQHTAIAQAVLNGLDNVPAARSIRRHVIDLFSPDTDWANFIAHQLDYWLRLR